MWSYEVSWRQRLLKGRLQYGINLFYLEADNIIQTVNRQNVNTGRLRNKGAELDVLYRTGKHWTLSTNHSWLDMRTPVLSAPKYKGYLGASMRYGRWTAAAGLMQVCGLYTAVAAGSERTEHFTLLNATLGFAACRGVRLWIKGDNLLAQRYEYVSGMPMPRATFMGGVEISL